MLLDHWLKCMEKSFSKFRNHVQSKKTASSMSLLLSKTSLENISLFHCCQIVHVTAIHHHHFHFLALNPSAMASPCCRKCMHSCLLFSWMLQSIRQNFLYLMSLIINCQQQCLRIYCWKAALFVVTSRHYYGLAEMAPVSRKRSPMERMTRKVEWNVIECSRQIIGSQV